MSDPRNVAHDKKVKQEKEHEKTAAPEPKAAAAAPNETPAVAASAASASSEELEKSLAVLSKLKDLEFHSRANVEALAQLSLTVEEELKQKEFSEQVGELYSAQDKFQTTITALIEAYAAHCESLRGQS